MKNQPIEKANDIPYIWGEQCDGWKLVFGENLSVIEERMPAGTSEARHRHNLARQFFYVLKGQLSIELDGIMFDLLERRGLEIAPGTPHQVFNRFPQPVEFLVISTPPTQGDRIDA